MIRLVAESIPGHAVDCVGCINPHSIQVRWRYTKYRFILNAPDRHLTLNRQLTPEMNKMELEKLSCNSCGAPLEVPRSARFVTCNHCSSQLSVCRTDAVTYTETLDELVNKTEELSEQVENLTAQNEIAALDREWEMERQKYMVSTNEGKKHIPTEGGSIGGGIAISIFGLLWTIFAFVMTSQAPDFGPMPIIRVVFPLAGVVFIAVGIGSSAVSYNKAGAYRRAEQQYQSRRDELMSR